MNMYVLYKGLSLTLYGFLIVRSARWMIQVGFKAPSDSLIPSCTRRDAAFRQEKHASSIPVRHSLSPTHSSFMLGKPLTLQKVQGMPRCNQKRLSDQRCFSPNRPKIPTSRSHESVDSHLGKRGSKASVVVRDLQPENAEVSHERVHLLLHLLGLVDVV